MRRKYNKYAMKRKANSIIALLFCLVTIHADLPPLVYAEGDPFEQARSRMVTVDLQGRDITDAKVLSAMGKVSRHLFIDKNLWDAAYNDYPLPIGEGQTISQPYIVALMTQSLNQAAVLAELVDQVYSIEIDKTLAGKAAKTLNELGYKKVQVKQGDGFFGWPEQAPFDAIMVTCAPEHIPEPLIQQLKDSGRLIIPVGSTFFHQTLKLLTRVKGENRIKNIVPVRFVPMTGEAEK